MYTDLISITHPASAKAGGRVEILVYIKNQHSATIGVKPRAVINSTIEVEFTVPYSNIPAGYTYYFTGYFTMPNANASIRAESYYYGADGVWHFEDYQTRTVSLDTTVPTGLKATSVNVTYGTYDLGTTVPFVLGYEYKGEAQSGTLKIELGTGVYPNFTPAAVVGPVPYGFVKKTDYTRVSENRTFALPSMLIRGQTYSVRATLTTADGLTDSDVDYTALRVLDNTVPSTDLQGLVVGTTYRDYALGESLPFTLAFKYKGISQAGTLQVVIKKGTAQVYAYGQANIQYEAKDTLTSFTWSYTVSLPKSLEPGQVYSLYVRLTTLDGKDTSDTKGSAFKIASAESPTDPGTGEYRVIKDYTYPYAENYRGAASEATATFSVPIANLPGGDLISQKVINAFESSVTEQGSHMLSLLVYEREEGLFAKGYKVIATATKPADTTGQEYTAQGIVGVTEVRPQFGPMAWALIIIAALALVAIIISSLVPSVRDVVWGEGGAISTIGSALELLPYMMIMMVLAMVMEQAQDLTRPVGAPPVPKPVTEKVVAVGERTYELGKKGYEKVKGGLKES